MKTIKVKVLLTSIKIFCIVLGPLALIGCTKNAKPSVLVIAADRLAFNSFSCSDEKSKSSSGLLTFCQESIRYSNALTTSTQSAAALGTILTGLYPFENLLRGTTHRLSSKNEVVSEIFKANGYRTSLFSANANVMRRTGLARGFDHFDDTSFISYPSYTVPFLAQIEQFKQWYDEEDSKPFFSILYTSDLETLRPDENHANRIEEFDDTLVQFIQYLRKNDLWDTNYIVVVGLQGRSEYNRLNETAYSNLHSENVNVSVFIKPPRQKGDEGVQLKIDSPISLVDVGVTLKKLAKKINQISTDSKEATEAELMGFTSVDHSLLWQSGKLDSVSEGPAEVRKILVESKNTWSSKLQVRFALYTGQYVYIEKEDGRLFNRLTDGFETIDISKNNLALVENAKKDLLEVRNLALAESWSEVDDTTIQMIAKSRRYWNNSQDREKLFNEEKERLAKKKPATPISTLLIYYLNAKKEKDGPYEEARRITYNLLFENIWGLWNREKVWNQPTSITEYQ